MKEDNASDDDESVNPSAPEWLSSEANALLRGDAIGDTVFTHRWVLKCLFTITQSLPKYLKGSSPTVESPQPLCNGENADELGEDADVTESLEGSHGNIQVQNNSAPSPEPVEDQNSDVLELDSETEDASCQIWDMTVERDVCLHLLNLEEADILHLAYLVISQSKSPRLTEVMVGIVANICCQEEGCYKILENDSCQLLESVFLLLARTSDVPTLCEIFRLLRLLVWHLTNRSSESISSQLSFIRAISSETFMEIVAFLLNNSLSDVLLSSLLEFLRNVLFLWLSDEKQFLAATYCQCDIIDGLMGLMERYGATFLENDVLEQDSPLHSLFVCLYSFVDTKAAPWIRQHIRENKPLESVIVKYVENEGMVESADHLVGPVADRLVAALGLCQVIVPFMQEASIIMTAARILSIIHGHTHHYIVRRSSSSMEISHDGEDEQKQVCSEATVKEGASQRRPRLHSGCKMLRDFVNNEETPSAIKHLFSPFKAKCSNSEQQQADPKPGYTPKIECGWLSPPMTYDQLPEAAEPKNDQKEQDSMPSAAESSIKNDKAEECSLAKKSLHLNITSAASAVDSGASHSYVTSTTPVIHDDLLSLDETVGDLCTLVLSDWLSKELNKAPKRNAMTLRSSSANRNSSVHSSAHETDSAVKSALLKPVCGEESIVDVLNQCHAHEVFLVLNAVRARQKSLVPALQERLLDKGTHSRLVTLLAHLYQ